MSRRKTAEFDRLFLANTVGIVVSIILGISQSIFATSDRVLIGDEIPTKIYSYKKLGSEIFKNKFTAGYLLFTDKYAHPIIFENQD